MRFATFNGLLLETDPGRDGTPFLMTLRGGSGSPGC